MYSVEFVCKKTEDQCPLQSSTHYNSRTFLNVYCAKPVLTITAAPQHHKVNTSVRKFHGSNKLISLLIINTITIKYTILGKNRVISLSIFLLNFSVLFFFYDPITISLHNILQICQFKILFICQTLL